MLPHETAFELIELQRQHAENEAGEIAEFVAQLLLLGECERAVVEAREWQRWKTVAGLMLEAQTELLYQAVAAVKPPDSAQVEARA